MQHAPVYQTSQSVMPYTEEYQRDEGGKELILVSPAFCGC